jgi:hypothetical protein
MEKLFKFVGILLVGTAIGACITANTKVDITPLKMVIKKTIEKVKNFDIVKTTKYDLESVSVDTIPKNLSTLERDIVTPKKTKTTKKLSNSQLQKKLEKEVGKDAIELWCNVSNTDWELDAESDALFSKTNNIIQNNFKSSSAEKEFAEIQDFKGFVYEQGFRDEYNNFRLNNNHNLPMPSSNPTLTKTATTQQQPKQLPKEATKTEKSKPSFFETLFAIAQSVTTSKKDFTNTRYTEDFVKKYRLDVDCIKTDADRELDKKWNKFLKLMANSLQQKYYGYDYTEAHREGKILLNEMMSYVKFVSYACEVNFGEKTEQVAYKLAEMEKTKRL